MVENSLETQMILEQASLGQLSPPLPNSLRQELLGGMDRDGCPPEVQSPDSWCHLGSDMLCDFAQTLTLSELQSY